MERQEDIQRGAGEPLVRSARCVDAFERDGARCLANSFSKELEGNSGAAGRWGEECVLEKKGGDYTVWCWSLAEEEPWS